MNDTVVNMWVGPSRSQSSVHEEFAWIRRYGCCCGLLPPRVCPSEWGRRPPEGGKVIHLSLVNSAELISGLRYINIDYAVASALTNNVKAGITDVVVTYDIACQWGENLKRRLSTYPSIPPLNITTLKSFRPAVPKFHLAGHKASCQSSIFNLAFMDKVGMTHGEGVETIWSHSTSLATWSRENGPHARHLILDDHWTGWNWSKLVGLRGYFL